MRAKRGNLAAGLLKCGILGLAGSHSSRIREGGAWACTLGHVQMYGIGSYRLDLADLQIQLTDAESLNALAKSQSNVEGTCATGMLLIIRVVTLQALNLLSMLLLPIHRYPFLKLPHCL